jgi:hypothetical protein
VTTRPALIDPYGFVEVSPAGSGVPPAEGVEAEPFDAGVSGFGSWTLGLGPLEPSGLSVAGFGLGGWVALLAESMADWIRRSTCISNIAFCIQNTDS